ncbi:MULTISPECIES: hypothetical protein [unclassified Sphingomonas]|uniref:hypothetical protein n=1 Tax=unclassified Sphingomonas TaxID=196159 RepID=UPI002789A5ED|nr:hypothetical protein [Sphingomonas sp. SORGH_AS_0879]MDQ1231600.1 hypothetical protein [Sphingomonas sp. SORGH_AS_0879]
MPETRAGKMCHKMRTQLGIIIGLVEIINLHDAGISPQSREDLQRIRTAAKTILDLVEQAEQQIFVKFV